MAESHKPTFTTVLIYDIRYMFKLGDLSAAATDLRKWRSGSEEPLPNSVPPSMIRYAIDESQFETLSELETLISEFIPDETNFGAWDYQYIIIAQGSHES